MTAGWRRFGLALIALGVALRVLIAPGMMPVPTSAGVTLTLCTAQGPVAYQLDIHGKQPASAAHDPCPYAAMGAIPLVAAPVALAVVHVITPLALAPFKPADVRPHIGAPAPPPPSTGPPLLA